MSRRLWITILWITIAVLVALGVIVSGSLLSWWDWKALIGWKALVGYIAPEYATERKDALQVYAVIVAGLVAAVTAAVGLTHLHYTRRNLEQQREIEEKRAEDAAVLESQRDQGAALQAYYEQMGKLLTEYDLGNTERDDIRLLARAQTLTVLETLEPPRKSRLMRFLTGSALVQNSDEEKRPVISLQYANLRGADLSSAYLGGADLAGANLRDIDLRGADLPEANLFAADLRGRDLRGRDLRGANLFAADLRGADLRGADLSSANLRGADLSSANLIRANLQPSSFLTQAQVNSAIVDESTKLPEGLHR